MCQINRFDPVLMALKKTNNPVLQLACLQFINAIVNTPEDIDFKIHLRNEFMRGGLGDVLMVSILFCCFGHVFLCISCICLVLLYIFMFSCNVIHTCLHVCISCRGIVCFK